MLSKEHDSKAAVGMLTAGSYGIAHVICLSFDDESTLDLNWSLLRLCRKWRIAAQYHQGGAQGGATLTLSGWGEPVPITDPAAWCGVEMRLAAIPEFQGQWDMDDPDAVHFFMAGVKRHGYFGLLPAIDQRVVETHRPLVGFITRQHGGTT